MPVDLDELSLHESGKRSVEMNNEGKGEAQSIQQFLNLGCFVDNNNLELEIQNSEKQQRCPIYASDKGAQELNETPQKTKRKSIFHNFQKHLITLLKKHFRITLKTFEGPEESQLAFALWQAFTKTKSYNKKVLHIIFGIQEGSHSLTEYQSLSQQFKEFRYIRNKHCLSAIMKAQELIRLQIIKQSKAINRLFFEANCNVSRLELFWEYFSSFILELEDGPMVKRMTKEQKGRLVSNFSTKSKDK